MARVPPSPRPPPAALPRTTAPEVLRNMNDTAIWTTKADVWQYGLLLCEAVSFGVGQAPLRSFPQRVATPVAPLYWGHRMKTGA